MDQDDLKTRFIRRTSVSMLRYEFIDGWDEEGNFLEEGRFLVMRRPDYTKAYQAKDLIRVFDAMDEPLLFLELVRCKDSEDKIVNFANKYGFLSENKLDSPGYLGVAQEKVVDENGIVIAVGESLTHWTEAINELAFFVNLWRLYVENDEKSIEKISHATQKSGIVYFTEHDDMKYLDDRSEENYWLAEYTFSLQDFPALKTKEPFYLFAAKTALCQRISKHTKNGGLVLDPTNFSLSIDPDDLHTVLWVQFALAVAQRTSFKECHHCKRPFAASGRNSRSDKKFCSNTCKYNAHIAGKKADKKAKLENPVTNL
jgi:hypothetical protein